MDVRGIAWMVGLFFELWADWPMLILSGRASRGKEKCVTKSNNGASGLSSLFWVNNTVASNMIERKIGYSWSLPVKAWTNFWEAAVSNSRWIMMLTGCWQAWKGEEPVEDETVLNLTRRSHRHVARTSPFGWSLVKQKERWWSSEGLD